MTPVKSLLPRLCVALFTLAAAAGLTAAPSGGPYGPIQKNYPVPQIDGTVFFVAPDGEDDAAGTDLAAPTTLESAISQVVTGDVIVLRGGTYRVGDLHLNQGITMQPYLEEQPVLKGTKVVDPEMAEKQRNGLYRIKWDTLFFLPPQPWWTRGTFGATTPQWLFNNDMVFVDGQPLKTVGWEGEVEEDSFSVDYENGNIYIAVDPAEHVVEITAWDNAITRVTGEVHGKVSDKIGPKLYGLTFTQYAYRAIEIGGYDPEEISPEEAHGNDVIGTTLEHCTITHCSRVAGYFRGDNMVFRHNLISDTSTEGIFILASDDALLERNIFRRNNVEGIRGYFPSAVKIFNQTRRIIVRDNLLYNNPGSNGIWYDVGNVDGVFINNWVMDGYNGFFFEISKGVVCAGNVFVNSSAWILNSSDAKIYNNTFVNSPLRLRRDQRGMDDDHFGWHPKSGPAWDERVGHVVRNNLFYSDGSSSESHALLNLEQPEALKDRLTDEPADVGHNVYVYTGHQANGVLRWAPVPGSETGQVEYESLAALREVIPTAAPHDVELPDYRGPLFQSVQLKRFEVSEEFPAAHNAGPIPAEIAELLGRDPAAGGTVGAY